MKKYTVIDLFCGCGGFTSGLSRAGLDVLAGVDIWDKAVETYKQNNNHIGLQKDLKIFSPVNFTEETKIKNFDILVGGPPCFVAGTKILTETGYKNIEELNLDDNVLTHTGKFQKINNLQKKSYSDVLYKIKPAYHPHYTTCTKEHPFYVKKIGCEPEWMEAQALTKEHFYGMPISTSEIIPEFSFRKKINQTAFVDEHIKLDKLEQWFLMGYFLGDGWTLNVKRDDGRLKYKFYLIVNNKQENELIPIFRK